MAKMVDKNETQNYYVILSNNFFSKLKTYFFLCGPLRYSSRHLISHEKYLTSGC